MIKRPLLVASIFVGLLFAVSAQAAATLTFVSAGSGAFQLQASGLQGAAGLDLTLSYAPSVLAAPQVTQGPLLSGAMMAVNPNAPGIVRISAVTLSPLTGSGALFTITFSKLNDGQGIRGLSARLIDIRGNPLASQVQIAVSSGSMASADSGASSESTSSPAQSGTASGSGPEPEPVGSGTTPAATPLVGILVAPPAVTHPVEPEQGRPGADAQPVETQVELAQPPEPAPVQTAKAGPEQRSLPIYTRESILDRFRFFSGKRTMQAYLGLFDQEPLIGFRQDPPVVLSDGKNTATVHFISTPEREHTSDLALVGARLIASRRDPDFSNTWIVTVLPEKGSTNVTLAVMQKNMLMVDPLTVAPKVNIDLNASGAVDDADFALFLRERGTAKKPKFDLNGDGVRDYRDDFIFTANYLAVRRGGAGKERSIAGTPVNLGARGGAARRVLP